MPGREAVTVKIGIAPSAATGRHTHTGDEIDYVLEGQLEVTIDGQPPRVLNAGESIVRDAGGNGPQRTQSREHHDTGCRRLCRGKGKDAHHARFVTATRDDRCRTRAGATPYLRLAAVGLAVAGAGATGFSVW